MLEDDEGKYELVIKCQNHRCYTEYKRESISMMDGQFSCPNCGFEEYKKIRVPYPKKKKDYIEFINNFNEYYE